MIDFSIARRAQKAWNERKRRLINNEKDEIYRMGYYRGFKDAQNNSKDLNNKADKKH